MPINYLTQQEFSQLDITAIDHILNGIHFHRSRLDGQEVLAIQARAVLTHGRNKPPEPAPRPQPDNNLDEGCDNNPTADGPDDPQPHNSRSAAGGDDPGAARSKRELRDAERRAARLADAKHERADQTAEAVKTAVIEADTESADDRFARQRKNRRGGCGVNDDGMYWLSLLIDPITGARIKHAYDPRFRNAWRLEKQLDHTIRRQPKQLAATLLPTCC